MCLVTEHAHALERIKELENQLTGVSTQLEECHASQADPVIPDFPVYGVPRKYFVDKMEALGVKAIPLDDNLILSNLYYYTNREGWAEVLYDLVFNSGLYRENKFMCFSYAIKAQNECAERYGLNGLRTCIDRRVSSAHAYCIFGYGSSRGIEKIMLFEPNEGFAWSGILEFGEHDYIPELVLV